MGTIRTILKQALKSANAAKGVKETTQATGEREKRLLIWINER